METKAGEPGGTPAALRLQRTEWRLLWVLSLIVLLLAPACRTHDRYMVEITRLNAFAPETLVIPRGTTVVWKNHDFEVHSSVSNPDLSPTDPRVMRSPALQWDSGDITSGETFFHHFDAPGTYLYFCRYHPQMTGTIVVAHEEELEEEDEDEEENGAEGEEQETQP